MVSQLMPCPFMGPKWLWTVQIILVNILDGSNLFWSGVNHFGQVQIIELSTEKSNLNLSKMIWTQPKWFGPDQNDLDPTKMNWTSKKRLVLDQNNLVGPKSFWTHRRIRHYSAIVWFKQIQANEFENSLFDLVCRLCIYLTSWFLKNMRTKQVKCTYCYLLLLDYRVSKVVKDHDDLLTHWRYM